jgi:DNA topoisomerase-2
MAIWSLTQERVDRLLKQIGDKEMEIDALIKLTPKDLWTHDLDAFVDEWNTQIDEEGKRAKKLRNMGRRDSKKLGIGASKSKTKKKRKMDDSDTPDDSDSDFGPVKKKAKPKSGGLLSYLKKDEAPRKVSATQALKQGAATAPKQVGMPGHLDKGSGKEPSLLPDTDGAMDLDPPAPPAAAVAEKKRGRPAGTKVDKKVTPIPVDSDDDSEDVFAAVAKEQAARKPTVKPIPTEKANGARAARGATKVVPNYGIDDDSDSDDLGDNLLDVSNMVKGIGATGAARPLFTSTTRPGSGGNGRPASSAGISKKLGRLGAQKSSPVEIDDADETNYEGLMPQASPQKAAPRNVNDTLMGSDDEDDYGFGVKETAPKQVPKAIAKAPAKATAKTKAAPKSKPAPAAVVIKKTTALSPAAKAYAAKFGKVKDSKPATTSKAKKAITVDSDDEMEDADDLANDILSDEDEPTPRPRAAATRPGRRAAAKPAKYIASDDDDEDSEAESEQDFDDDSE